MSSLDALLSTKDRRPTPPPPGGVWVKLSGGNPEKNFACGGLLTGFCLFCGVFIVPKAVELQTHSVVMFC